MTHLKYFAFILLVFLFFSCKNKKRTEIKQEQTISKETEKNVYKIDSVQLKKDMAEYLTASKKIDSLWDDLAGGPVKPSKKKRPNFEAISKKLLDTLSTVQSIIDHDKDNYIINTDEQLYKKKHDMDSGEMQGSFEKIRLATEQLRDQATFKAIENMQKQFKIPENTMLVEQFREKAGKPSNDVLMLGLIKANKEQATTILSSLFEMKPEEIELMVKIPNSKNIETFKKSEKLPEKGLSKEVFEYLKKNSKNVSKAFKRTINSHRIRTIYSKQQFLIKAQKVKKKFMKLNPTWYSSKQAEDFYMDAKNNLIYLPLGKLSFADKVIKHDTGKDDLGDFTQGCIGEPNIVGKSKYKDFFDGSICNLGEKGALTVQFTDNVLIDVNGPDLYVFEIGAIEPTKLEISQDGENWIDIGKIDGGTAYVDIHDFVKPNQTFNYVRLTDLETYSSVPGADIDAIATIGGALRLSLDSEVLFEVGKHQLKKEGLVAISKLSEQIETLQKGLITIEGHTDDTGSVESNQELSKKRATSVANELKQLIKSKNFKWKEVGYGESRPIVKNDSDENRQINRRVEILVMPTNN